jgi:hypothetical protein
MDVARSCIPNKKTYYGKLRDVGWHLPLLSSPIITLDWLTRVRYGDLFCLKVGVQAPGDSTRYARPMVCPCFSKVKKCEAIEALVTELHSRGFDMGITASKIPDKTWALEVLCTLNPTHAFYSRDFRLVSIP